MFFDMWKYVYSENVFNTLYIEIKEMLKKFRTKWTMQQMPSCFFHELKLITPLFLICDS